MGRSQETFNKKEVRNKKEKKRKEKAKKKLAKKDQGKSSLDEMIAYVDENGVISNTPPDSDNKTEIRMEDIEVSVPKKDPANQEATIRQGRVSYFNSSKGYGFIKDSDTHDSIFVHINDVGEEIAEGDTVSFETVKGQKGPAAIHVKKLK